MRTFTTTMLIATLLMAACAVAGAETSSVNSAKPIVLAQAEPGGIGESAPGGNILNPLPGEESADRQPMIGVKLPQPDPPIKPDTIKIVIDGDDVTSETQVSVEHIFYTPSIPLKLGIHNVTISYEDFEGKSDSIEWQFTIVAVAARKTPSVREKEPSAEPSTSGKVSLVAGNVFLNEGTRSPANNAVASDIKYKESPIFTQVFDITHEQYGKTFLGHFDRSIEEITGRANDRGYIKMTDASKVVTLGDFTTTASEYSEYTMSGVRMRGMKNVQDTPFFKYTFFGGRSQEPQNGLFMRYTVGSMFEKTFTPSYNGKLILLRTREKGVTAGATVPRRDAIYSFVNNYKFSPSLKLYAELAGDKHSEFAGAPNASGRDSATKLQANYVMKPFDLTFGRRTVGPNYNPTTLGTFIEKDREGTYGTLKITPNDKWTLTTFYDDYHDNLHHTKTADFTQKTGNSKSSVSYSAGKIENLTYNYSKLYTDTDTKGLGERIINDAYSESTTENLTFKYALPDVQSFIGNSITGALSRYDIDRFTYTVVARPSDLAMRSNTTNYTFATRYKALYMLSYNSTVNKTDTYSKSGIGAAADEKTDFSRTITDNLSFRYNHNKSLISSINLRRSAKRTITQSYDALGNRTVNVTSNVLDLSRGYSLIYMLPNSKKLTLNIVDYDKQFRTGVNRGRAYDERQITLGYDFAF